MRHGWEIKKLGEVCTFRRGLTYTKGDEVEFSENCVLRSNNIDLDTMSIVLDDLKCVRKDLAIGEDKIVKPNTILVCMSNGSKQHIGKVAFIDREYGYAFGGFMGLIIPQSIFPKYVYYSCLSPSYKHFLRGIGNGANITNLKFSNLSNYTIPVPPLSEQERIVAELDLLSDVIAKKREQLKQLDTLAQSIFYDMFGDPITNEKGWETKKLGEISTSQIGITYKPEDVSDNGMGTVVLRSGNIQNSSLCFNDIIKVNKDIREDKYVKDGDILMCSRNGSFQLVGKVAMITTLKERMTYGAFMTVIRSDYQPFLFAFFKSPAFRSQLTTAKTATINQITIRMLENMQVILPPLTLQQEFASKIEAIEKQKELIKQSLSEVQQLFDSRMDYYFG